MIQLSLGLWQRLAADRLPLEPFNDGARIAHATAMSEKESGSLGWGGRDEDCRQL